MPYNTSPPYYNAPYPPQDQTPGYMPQAPQAPVVNVYENSDLYRNPITSLFNSIGSGLSFIGSTFNFFSSGISMIIGVFCVLALIALVLFNAETYFERTLLDEAATASKLRTKRSQVGEQAFLVYGFLFVTIISVFYPLFANIIFVFLDILKIFLDAILVYLIEPIFSQYVPHTHHSQVQLSKFYKKYVSCIVQDLRHAYQGLRNSLIEQNLDLPADQKDSK